MLEALLRDGWGYHETESERLARELEAAGSAGVPSTQLAAFVHLATHTIGQHLRDWPRALALGRRVLESQPASAEMVDASGRLYVAAVMAGEALVAVEMELECLKRPDPLADLLSMRFLLAEVLVDTGRRSEGGRLYRELLGSVRRTEAPLHLERRIAATSNNVAWMLHDLPSRTVDEIALMRLAAEASLAAWRRCGDWINVELGLYLGASAARVAGDPAHALRLSAEGLELIAGNGLRPFDAARFHLLRAVVFAELGKGDDRASALANADAAAQEIALDGLRQQFAVERAKAISA
jgi:hypothetical protein